MRRGIAPSSVALASALAVLAGCDATPPDRMEAGDAGYVYVPGIAVSAVARVSPDAGAADGASAAAPRPSLSLVAGVLGGRGDLDGVGEDARVGLTGGMVRVGDALVFADEGNGSIRRFVPATGAVETLAHLPAALDGRPSLPAFVAYDGHGRVFVTDRSSQVVYALDLATKAVTVFAGKPSVRGDADGDGASALFDAPTGLAFDGDHTLFVADTGSRHLRKIDTTRGSVTTLPGTFPQLWGLCMDGGALYATENLDEAVLQIDTASGAAKLVAGSNRFGYGGPTDGPAKTARFREPRGIACGADALYVADRGNSSIRRVDRKTGDVTTAAGQSGVNGFRDGYGPQAKFDDVQSTLLWGDTLYIGDEATLRAFSLKDSVVRTVLGAADQIQATPGDRSFIIRPEEIVVPKGERAAYLATCGSSTVQRIDLDTGTSATFVGDPYVPAFVDGSATDARFHCLTGIASDDAGSLFLADSGNHAVRAVQMGTRRVVTVAGSSSRCGNDDGSLDVASFCDPSSVVFDRGVLYVADAATSTIRKIDLAKGVVTTLAGTAFVRGYADGAGTAAKFAAPMSLALSGGALYVADRDNDVLRRVDVATGQVTTFAGAAGQAGMANGALAAARFDHPRGLAATDGGIFVLDRGSMRKLAFDSATVTPVLTGAGGVRLGASAPSFSTPVAAFDLGGGEALVVDRAENAVLRLAY